MLRESATGRTFASHLKPTIMERRHCQPETLTCQCLRNTLTQSVTGRTVRMNGEGSFNPSAPARLDLQPLAIPRHPPSLRDADS